LHFRFEFLDDLVVVASEKVDRFIDIGAVLFLGTKTNTRSNASLNSIEETRARSFF